MEKQPLVCDKEVQIVSKALDMCQMMFPNIFINIVLLINVFVSHNKTDRQSHDGKSALLDENL